MKIVDKTMLFFILVFLLFSLHHFIKPYFVPDNSVRSTINLAYTSEKRVTPFEIFTHSKNVSIGNIQRGQEIIARYIYVNDYNFPIRIHKISTQCSCTSIEFTESLIMPNEEAIISFAISSDNYVNEFSTAASVIIVEENGINVVENFDVTFDGFSVDDIFTGYKYYNLGTVFADQLNSKLFIIQIGDILKTNDSESFIPLISDRTYNGLFLVKKNNENDSSITLEIKNLNRIPIGQHNIVIDIINDSKIISKIIIDMEILYSSIEITPASIALGVKDFNKLPFILMVKSENEIDFGLIKNAKFSKVKIIRIDSRSCKIEVNWQEKKFSPSVYNDFIEFKDKISNINYIILISGAVK